MTQQTEQLWLFMIELKDMNKKMVSSTFLKTSTWKWKKARRSRAKILQVQENQRWSAVINRLEEHQKGHILHLYELSEDLKNIEAVRRDVGMCFQHFNLFLT